MFYKWVTSMNRFASGLLLVLIMSGAAQGQDVVASDVVENTPQHDDFKSIDQEIQTLKQDVIELNRDLFILEEELLFPSNTQVAVFVSIDVGTLFGLDSVQIKLNDKVVSNYLYTQREVDALHRGGVHRIYMGNLRSGEHELVALLVGKGPHGRDYRRGATVKFEKQLGPKHIELKISDKVTKLQPEFVVKQW